MDKYTEARDLVNRRGPNLGTPDIALAMVKGMVADVDTRLDSYVDDIRALVNVGADENAILATTALVIASSIPHDILAILFVATLIREARHLAIV